MSARTKSTGAGVSLRRSQPRLGERAIEAVLFLAAAVGPDHNRDRHRDHRADDRLFREPAVTVWGFLTGPSGRCCSKNPSRNSAYCRW